MGFISTSYDSLLGVPPEYSICPAAFSLFRLKRIASFHIWGDLSDQLNGEIILSVRDIEDKTWFDTAPMLAELTSGTLSVHVKCEKDLAIGWNIPKMRLRPTIRGTRKVSPESKVQD